jgi:hypothetical protein
MMRPVLRAAPVCLTFALYPFMFCSQAHQAGPEPARPPARGKWISSPPAPNPNDDGDLSGRRISGYEAAFRKRIAREIRLEKRLPSAQRLDRRQRTRLIFIRVCYKG